MAYLCFKKSLEKFDFNSMKVRYGDLIRIGRGKQQKSGEKIRTCIWPAPKNLTPSPLQSSETIRSNLASMPLSAKESQTLLYIQVWSNQDQ